MLLLLQKIQYFQNKISVSEVIQKYTIIIIIKLVLFKNLLAIISEDLSRHAESANSEDYCCLVIT